MKRLKSIINPLAIIFLAVFLRLVPHMPNFAPITAMALFGGVYLGKKYALIIPLAIMAISDYLLLYVNPFSPTFFNFSHIYPFPSLLHSTTLAVYGSFVISGVIGIWLKNHKSPTNVLGAALFTSIQFFLITNAAVWIAGAYDRSILGLWQSYVMGIPFFRGTVLGDLFYTTVFFGGYEAIQALSVKRKALRVVNNITI